MENTILPPPSGDPKNIVIIGGGAVGALTAFQLQMAGHRVTLLEARGWGNGSSSRSAACIRSQFGTPSTVKGMVYCTTFYERWMDIIHGGGVPIVQNGYLFLKDWSADREAVERLVEMQHAAGLPEVEILDRAALDARFPYLETTGVQFATFCEKDGFLDPGAVYTDAVAAAKGIGAKAFQNAEVVEVLFDRDDCPAAVLTADGRKFEAEVFVNAGGVWAPRISAMFGGHSLAIDARRRYLYFLDGFNGNGGGDFMSAEDFTHLPMTITPRGCYCRPESVHGGKLMMGWLHHTSPIEPTFDNQDEIEPGFSTGLMDYGAALRKEIATYLPDAAESMGRIAAVTAGFYEDTPDHNPLIGFDPKVPNLIHAAGFSGHGLMHAPFTAATVAELIAAGHDLKTIQLPIVGEVDVDTFQVNRVFAHGESMVI